MTVGLIRLGPHKCCFACLILQGGGPLRCCSPLHSVRRCSSGVTLLYLHGCRQRAGLCTSPPTNQLFPGCSQLGPSVSPP